MSEGTSFEVRCDILADLWQNYKQDEQFQDFVSYNDIGLPFSFLIAEQLATPAERGKAFVNETFDLLLKALDIPEDEGYDSLDDLLML
jgi:hypothetical protein